MKILGERQDAVIRHRHRALKLNARIDRDILAKEIGPLGHQNAPTIRSGVRRFKCGGIIRDPITHGTIIAHIHP